MKIHYIFFIAALCASAASCNKELARADVYQEIPELWVDTAGSPPYGWYTIKQNIEELSISPNVVYTGDKTLDYYWIRSNNYSTTGYPTYDDTVSHEKDLNMYVTLPLSSNALIYNAYSFFFQVKERETGNMAVIEYKVTVIGTYDNGLLVAHEKDGTADIDLIETPTGTSSPVYRNIHQTVNGNRLPGKVIGNVGSMNTGTPVIFATDQAFSLLSWESLALLVSNEDIFGDLNVNVFKPEWFRSTTFLNNGKVYGYSNGLMVTELSVVDGSDYRVAPPLVDYHPAYFVFDELNGRMLKSTSWGFTFASTLEPYASANEGRRFSLDNIDRKMLYAAQGISVNSTTTFYSVFEDKVPPANKYIYVFTLVTPLAPDWALIDINGVTDVQQAFAWQTITSAPVMYYATPQHLRLLLIDVTGNQVQEAGPQFTAPAGEEITSIFSDNNARCYVATYEAATGEGKVYLMGRSTGTGVFDSTPTKTWAGFGGRITQMGLKQ